MLFTSGFHVHFRNSIESDESIVLKEYKFKGKLPERIKLISGEISKYNEITEIEKVFIDYGLINITDVDNSIIIDLQYASNNNFLGKNLYGNLKSGYLQKDVVNKLHKAAVKLCLIKPEFTLVVLDAARPLSFQKIMWNEANLKPSEKEKFLANPSYGSLHNFGAAVDLTISDAEGRWLDMGTDYDSFEDLAWPALEKTFLKNGQLTKEQYKNRALLRSIMTESGFTGIETEWWHFNSCTRVYARKNYPLIISHVYAENPALITPDNVAVKSINENVLTDASPSDITFRVQIMTSADALNGDESLFKSVKVERYYHNNLYKYTSGKFKSIKEAHEQLVRLQKLGFADAFIVAFEKDKRIGIRDAAEILK